MIIFLKLKKKRWSNVELLQRLQNITLVFNLIIYTRNVSYGGVYTTSQYTPPPQNLSQKPHPLMEGGQDDEMQNSGSRRGIQHINIAPGTRTVKFRFGVRNQHTNIAPGMLTLQFRFGVGDQYTNIAPLAQSKNI